MPDVGPALKAIADYGLSIVALVALSIVLWKLIRDYLATLKAQLSRALDGWEKQANVTERLADALEERNRLDRDRR